MGPFDAKMHPWVAVAGAPEGVNGGYLDPEDAHAGVLADGTSILAIPLESGGTGGVFTQIVFQRKNGQPFAYVGYLGSEAHLAVTVANGAIVARFPKYSDSDANCCPSKLTIQTYDLAAGKLHKLSETTVPAPKPH